MTKKIFITTIIHLFCVILYFCAMIGETLMFFSLEEEKWLQLLAISIIFINTLIVSYWNG